MYLVFDTETTGFGTDARIVQLAWSKYCLNGEQLDHYNFLIKPVGFEIPEESIKVHGITNELAQAKGFPIKEVLDKFLHDIITAKYYVGHSIKFDIRMVASEFFKRGKRVMIEDGDCFCTMNDTKKICGLLDIRGRIKNPKLIELHQFLFGEGFESAHDAMADVNATAKCFFELKKRGLVDFGKGE